MRRDTQLVSILLQAAIHEVGSKSNCQQFTLVFFLSLSPVISTTQHLVLYFITIQTELNIWLNHVLIKGSFRVGHYQPWNHYRKNQRWISYLIQTYHQFIALVNAKIRGRAFPNGYSRRTIGPAVNLPLRDRARSNIVQDPDS